MTRVHRYSRPRGASLSQRGFTLVELLVALTGGLFVSIAVFALARDASRFYQREGRLANATLAGMVGFERLRADLARAGFLSTANIRTDPAVCSRPNAPDLLADLTSVLVTDKGSTEAVANATLAANGLAPDSVLLSGSFNSADEFPTRAVLPNDNGTATVFLQTLSGPMARLGYTVATNKEERERLLGEVFAANRVLRIVDNEGRQHFGVIDSVEVDETGAVPTITLSNTVPLQFRAGPNQFCGLKGLETGATVNIVNFIRYDVKSLAGNADYSELYGGSSYAPDRDRTELVRSEIDVNGDVVLEELAAEFAVDLQFDLTAVRNGPTSEPTVALLTPEDALFTTVTSTPRTAGSRPQDIRAIRARLSVRSREADRATNITSVPGSIYRMALGPDGQGPFARVRTLQADIMLNNHAGIQW